MGLERYLFSPTVRRITCLKYCIRKAGTGIPCFPDALPQIFRSLFGDRTDDYHIVSRLNKLKESGILKSGWLSRNSIDAKSLMLLMIALKSAPRFDDVLSRKTGLTIPEIRAFIDQLENWGWINSSRQLTNEGQKQVRHARKTQSEKNFFHKRHLCIIIPSR